MGGGREGGGGARAQWNSERVSESKELEHYATSTALTFLERAAQGCDTYVHVIRGMDHECEGFLFATTYTHTPLSLTPHTP